MKLRWIALSIPVALIVLAAGHQSAGTSDQLKDEIQRTALQFFLDQAHPVTGLVRDKAENFRDETPENNVASIASTGFALAVISHAAAHGKTDPAFAKEYCAKTVRFMRDHVARKYDLERHIRYSAEVTTAEYDDARSMWTLRLKDGSTIEAQTVISAVGQLHQPAYPNIPGRDSFRGKTFHSSNWDHGYALEGKNVAVYAMHVFNGRRKNMCRQGSFIFLFFLYMKYL